MTSSSSDLVVARKNTYELVHGLMRSGAD
uniref:Uncharacterized protein n=1 Tax=Musa acuminata subsp. malaccensis TaxID=214687 RepID=A0A804K964_MUSAM